jgi:hypothetical protein
MSPDTMTTALARTKHRPRFRRAAREDRPAFRLTDRDREMLKIIFDYRFITAAMLQDLVRPPALTKRQQDALEKLRAYKQANASDIGTAQGAQTKTRREILRRLQMLYHAGYVQRQKLADGEPIIYSLGNLGADELMMFFGYDRKQIDWTTRARESSDRYIRHGLMISRFRHAVELAVRKAPDVSLLLWDPAGSFTATVEYVDTVNTREGARTQVVEGKVIPDGFFVLQQGKRRIAYFLEADRSTMSHARYLNKLKAYYHYWNTQIRTEKDPAKKRHIRVLTITISEERKKYLRKTAQSVSTEAKNLFWFGCERSYRDEPEQVISSIWQTLKVDMPKHLYAND